MDSWECQTRGHIETAHSSASLWFFSVTRQQMRTIIEVSSFPPNPFITIWSLFSWGMCSDPKHFWIFENFNALFCSMRFPRGLKEVKCKTCQIVVSITWESWGLFQLTGTSPLELEPDEVEEVLLVTAITGGFPFRPAAVRWSPYLCPMIGVCRGKWCQLITKITINEGKNYYENLRQKWPLRYQSGSPEFCQEAPLMHC